MSKALLDRFLGAIPKAFVTTLLERQLPLYQQSVASAFNEQPWTDAEAITLLPYLRRALWEAEVRRAADACGLRTFDMPHVGKNSSCVHIKAGSVILTAHYVDSPNEFVREAESRKQNAGVNRWLNHYVDSRLLTTPVPQLGERPIYVNMLHGAWFPTRREEVMKIDSTTCFLRFGIPAADSNQYLAGCVWSAQELLPQYAPVAAAEPTPKSMPDEARPSIKRKKA
jgi:hypothetical protein